MQGQKQRIMIINWRWSDFSNNEAIESFPIATKAKLEKIEAKSRLAFLENTSKNNPTLCDIYNVRTENHQRIISNDNASNDKIIRLYLDKNDVTSPIIKQLVEKYHTQNQTSIFLFLHRGNGYTKDDVVQLKEQLVGKLQKCFLFEGGRDYIYYKTQNEGLLDDSGDFKVDRYRGIQVADDNLKIVYKKYFDKVWKYYEHEFKRKFFELEEALTRLLLTNLHISNKTTFSNFDILEMIRQDKNTYLLYQSFLDQLSKNELRELERIEQAQQKSLIYDDSFANLSKNQVYIYESLKKLLAFQNGSLNTFNKKEFSERIQTISYQFNQLIKLLPGNIYS